MDKTIVLEATSERGEPLQAIFLPEKGMNLVSYKKGDTEVIAQGTKGEFEKTFSGLGPLIGPHFSERLSAVAPRVENESAFPHIAQLREMGCIDPFPFGVGRYAPWNVKFSESELKASLSGKDEWMGIPLSTIQGQGFEMRFCASLQSSGLYLDLSIVSDTDSIIGTHYYFTLPQEKGKVISDVAPTYYNHGQLQEVSKRWERQANGNIEIDPTELLNVAFHPFLNPLKGSIRLACENYQLNLIYQCDHQENSWQLYHVPEADSICINPVTSQNPWRPNLTVSAIKIAIIINNSV